MFSNVCAVAGMMCIGPLVALLMSCNEKLGQCFGAVYACGVCCSMLACFIAGAVWRFSAAGTYASQAYDTEGMTELDDQLLQTSSGKFMFIFYIINFSVMGLVTLCSVGACLCKCLSGGY